MILALDVGNTNIVAGCIENGIIDNIFRMRTDVNQTSVEYAVKLREIFEILKIDYNAFESAIISCVVPQVTKSLTDAIKLLTGISCKIVGPGMKTGLNVCIDDPGTLAADLAVGAVAAINYYGSPCIIVDMGTATTITVVDGKNRFLGGAIMPGVNLSYSALSSGTSLLPHISILPPPKTIGSNTVDCMRSGAVYGNAALIDGMIDRMEKELGEKCKLIATGGLAQSVTKYCSHDIACDENLLLKGMWVLYNKNR